MWRAKNTRFQNLVLLGLISIPDCFNMKSYRMNIVLLDFFKWEIKLQCALMGTINFSLGLKLFK
jgi:hypothetical protein